MAAGAPARVGVVGAGTMGAGIAQIAVLGGTDALLHDPDPKALHRGIDRTTSAIEKGVRKGRWTPDQAVAVLGRIAAASELEDLRGAVAEPGGRGRSAPSLDLQRRSGRHLEQGA